MAFNRVGESGWCDAIAVRTTIGGEFLVYDLISLFKKQ